MIDILLRAYGENQGIPVFRKIKTLERQIEGIVNLPRSPRQCGCQLVVIECSCPLLLRGIDQHKFGALRNIVPVPKEGLLDPIHPDIGPENKRTGELP